MSEATALVYEEQAELAEKVRRAVQRADYRVKTTRDETRFWATYFDEGPDLVLVDFKATWRQHDCQTLLDRLRSVNPHVGVLFLIFSYSAPRRCLAEAELSNPLVEVVGVPLRAGELRLRVERLRRVRDGLVHRKAKPPADPGFLRSAHVLPELHDTESGRIDAKKVSVFLGLSLAEVARLVGKTRAALHKTPDAPSVQKKLGRLSSVASALLRLLGSAEAARIWLNSPNPELEGAIPTQLIQGGEVQVVDELLRDALIGQPG